MAALRVLVVEDVPELSRLLEMTFELEERFVPVGVASDGDEALAMARDLLPDAVVLDMSVDDGTHDLVPRLQSLVPAPKIVIFTGQEDDGRRQAALAAGASAYIVKGGDLEPLLEALLVSTR